MDFIEKMFGISPDGGNGSTEVLYLVALIVGIGAVLGLYRTYIHPRIRGRN